MIKTVANTQHSFDNPCPGNEAVCVYFVNVNIWKIVGECAKKKRKRRSQ